MTKKLELRHLAAYLPYKLKCQNPKNYYYSGCRIDSPNLTMCGLRDEYISFDEVPAFYPIVHFKPILRPLSDLTKEIEVNEERFVPALVLAELAMNKENVKEVIKNSNSFGFDYKIVNKPFGKILKVTRLDEWILLISLNEPERCKHYIFEKLIEWHFDVFSLIEAGLAIDINTLNT